jgi:hypothetical protein
MGVFSLLAFTRPKNTIETKTPEFIRHEEEMKAQ